MRSAARRTLAGVHLGDPTLNDAIASASRTIALVSTVAVLAGLAAPAAAQDVIIRRDGGRVAGKLQACIGERCTFDGQAMPRAEVLWIGFDVDEAAPPSGQSTRLDEIHLADGRVVRGEILGISLGEVAASEGSFERERVAWVRFAGHERPPSDLLIRRTGETTAGTLESCSPSACTFAGAPVSRLEIAWLGLATGEASPPAMTELGDDAVHLRSGEAESAEVFTVDAATVVTARGSHDRADVVWLYLAPPPPDRRGQPDQLGAPPDRSQPPSRTGTGGGSGPADRTGAPTRPAVQPPAAPSDEGEPCQFWVGAIESSTDWLGALVDGRLLRTNSQIGVVLREAPDAARNVWLVHDGTIVHEQLTDTMPDADCSAPGSFTLRGEPAGLLVVNEADVELSRGGAIVVPPRSIGYGFNVAGVRFQEGAPRVLQFTTGCGDEQGFTQVNVEVPPAAGRGPRFVAMSNPSTRMRGSYVHEQQEIQTKTAWTLDRVEAPCGSPPSPPGRGGPGPRAPRRPAAEDEGDEDEDCPEPTIQRALMDPIWQERQALAEQMLEALRELQAAQSEVDFNAEAWRASMALCGIYDIVFEVVKDQAGNFAKVVDLASKMIEGDLSYLVTNDDLSMTLTLLQAAYAVQGAERGRGLREKLDGCTALPSDLRAAAEKFADNYPKVVEGMPRVQQPINEIRSNDQQYWDQWHQYHLACLEHAECRGLPADSCEAPPESPSGPISTQQTSQPTPPPGNRR